MKEPVKRKKAMFVKNGQSADQQRMNAVAPGVSEKELRAVNDRVGAKLESLGIGGGNSTEPKVVTREDTQPCHGSESIPRQIEEEKCFPGVLRDPEVDATQERVDMTDTVSVEDFRLYLKEVGMTQRDFSRFTRTPYDTVRGWARRAARIPGTAVTVLVMLRRDKVMAAACRGTGWEPLW